MIHETVAGLNSNTYDAPLAGPRRSPARMLAEALWSALWHGAMAIGSGARRFLLAERIRRERVALSALSDVQLSDIGVDRASARVEAARGFGDVPSSRR